MLGKKKNDDEEVRAFLGKGAEFTGKLMFNGSVRIDGDFKGSIFGSGILVIGEGAKIEADIRADAVMISGEVRGQIDAKRTIQIYSTGKVLGNINTPLFAVEEGAFFEGTCHMTCSETDIHTLLLEQTAAKTTGSLIEGTIKAIQHGNELTHQTQEAFRENAAISVKVEQLVDGIAAALQGQSQGIGQVIHR